MSVLKFKKVARNTGYFLLYGVIFSGITYITSLLPDGRGYTHTSPISVALADHSDGGAQDGAADGCAGDGSGDGSGSGCP